jgi:hypothetical protein
MVRNIIPTEPPAVVVNAGDHILIDHPIEDLPGERVYLLRSGGRLRAYIGELKALEELVELEFSPTVPAPGTQFLRASSIERLDLEDFPGGRVFAVKAGRNLTVFAGLTTALGSFAQLEVAL